MDDVRELVLQELRKIAPETDPAALDLALPLAEQVDIDSMDWLNFLIGVHRATGVEIGEDEYDEVATLEGLVATVVARRRQ